MYKHDESAERSRQMWAALTDREKRHGKIFGALVFGIAILLVLADANINF